MKGASLWWSVLICSIGMALSIPRNTYGQADSPHESEDSVFDCGTLALYHLLRIEGRATDLATIESKLPAVPPDGYSMKELREAARVCGLPLSGIQLTAPMRQLDRPMVALLRHGHYVVVRPVGHTGKLVQVIDGVNDSAVTEREMLVQSRGWSGLALVPRRAVWAGQVASVLFCLSSLGLSIWLLPKLRILGLHAPFWLFWPRPRLPRGTYHSDTLPDIVPTRGAE